MLTKLPIGSRSAFLLLLFWLSWGWSQAMQAGECIGPVARAASIQGRVEVLSAGASTWQAVVQGDRFCPGDRLRVGADSRAGFTLNDDTLLRLAENSSLVVSAPAEDGSAWVDLLEGIAHFISRVRHSFQVNTPYVNASIEGTEFTVDTSPGRARVIVLEGRVRAHNARGEVFVDGGQRAESRQGEAPWVETVVDPMDAVQWVLYYPAVIDLDGARLQAGKLDPGARQSLERSIEAYRQGDLAAAFTALAELPAIQQDTDLLIYRASLYLQVGRIDAARGDLEAVREKQPRDAQALALLSVISTVRNERQTALSLAEQAVLADPQAAAAHLALSYARQARFQLADALASARQAVAVAPDNPLAWSRLAQLQLMFRRLDEAAEAARRATQLAPDQSQTQTTLGFAQLIRLDLDAADQAFRKAATIDQAAPLPRLGLGLVRIRRGDLAEGRRQIETAANLDPGNALIRSYLGKAYFEEKRDKQAAAQFELAKQFDGLDPTAWFYDAIRKQTENRPLEALDDLQTAIALNDNRAVYRSRLLLDEDQAARSASLARIYGDLGFERLALKESWKFLATDPANPSAHRFLSDTYANEPRHEIARVSELLQAQLLQQTIVTPVSPSASESDLLTFEGSGPSIAGFNEYNPLFDRPHLTFLASGLTGSNNTRGSEATAGAFANRGMLSAGYFTENSDGYRENNDSKQTIRNIFGQYRISSNFSVQGEIKHKDGEFGDLIQRFDPNLFSTITRRDIESDSSRLGVNYSPNLQNTFLFSVIQQELTDKTSQGTTSVDLHTDGTQHEAQYIYQGEKVDLLTGVGKAKSKEALTTKLTITSPFPGLPDIEQTIHNDQEFDQKSAYAYANLSSSNGTGIIGIDYLNIDDGASFRKKQFNPKLGLLWDISKASRVRLAAFRTMRGIAVNNQTLSPSQVAGFNQLLDDTLGTKAWRYGAAIDSQLKEKLYAGIELTRRTATDFVSSSSLPEEDHQELHHEAYLSWASTKYFSLTGRYIYDDFEREYTDGEFNFDRPAALNTRSLLLQMKFHHPTGVFGNFGTTHVSQQISNVLPTTGTETEDDSFWISDAAIGMRLPKRTGIMELKINNLFDRDFKYQSTHPGTGTPLASPYYPERSVFVNLQLWFF